MKVTAEKLENNRAQLTVEVPQEKFEVSLQKAFRTVVRNLNVPGFRKGKAPRYVVERMYGREIFLDDALNEAIPEAYLKALEEAGEEFASVSYPEYEVVQVEKGRPLIFKAVYDLKPDVQLGPYKGLELRKESDEVTEKDVDEELQRMQERFCRLEVIETSAQNHDILTIDFVGKMNGEPFEGGTAVDYSLELGSDVFGADFEEQLIGVMPGEEAEVYMNLPGAYESVDMTDKPAVFNVKVKEIKRKILSPLDDEFAKDVSEFETLQALRESIEAQLKENAEARVERNLRKLAVKTVVAKAELTLPDSMIQMRVDQLVDDFGLRLKRQGIDLNTYIEKTNIPMETFRSSYEDRAQEEISSDLVLEAIAKAEGIQATEEEIEAKIQEMAKQAENEEAVDKLKERLIQMNQLASIEHGIKLEKTIDWIIEQSDISVENQLQSEA
jgi:trigger factor